MPISQKAPEGWMRLTHVKGCAYRRDDLLVMVSYHVYDEVDWKHVSFSHPTRLPDWNIVREIKDTFIGKDKTAIIVLPPDDKHINFHEFCHHLWSPDKDIIPDFTEGRQII